MTLTKQQAIDWVLAEFVETQKRDDEEAAAFEPKRQEWEDQIGARLLSLVPILREGHRHHSADFVRRCCPLEGFDAPRSPGSSKDLYQYFTDKLDTLALFPDGELSEAVINTLRLGGAVTAEPTQ